MVNILIVYDSKTGNTEKTAFLVAEGVRKVNGVNCVVKRVEETTLDDLLGADGIILGSPTYYGGMSAKIKDLIDRSVKIHGKLDGKVGAAFTTSGGTATGAETTLLSIIEALLIHGMIVKGEPEDKHYGLAIVGAPETNEDKNLCREFGFKFANLVVKIFGDARKKS
ncbi:MAG: NAD(P)H-dependent oxidoreductase [Candidatus Bathyarchaeota archaeon]|nr:NAD(P)H-dependent oxidoreductase [Candidatus Bathyarchaeota archaeon]